ncbi:MgtC/SapB family protein [Intestinibacillus sp. Marseille-P6563]|uniref:MgtC/SapB family protein n=1 Tax=Intestinibacillus sp. Marseille-P6563 TaxID=2364792 RepID=UPI000F04FCC4|nr:MgtC/SapB family protein [Intestinibacillus sp. Marseille-P6563]
MQSVTIWDIIFRLSAAMIVGIIVGGQRAKTAHPAGLRTHMLVALGAAVVMIVGSKLYQDTLSLYQGSPDPARLGAQVISGVGFLGAGTILKDGTSVRGLTTAASLWSVACLGLAAGMGYYVLSFLGSGAIFITLSVFDFIQSRLQRRRMFRINLNMECSELGSGLMQMDEICTQNHVAMQNISFGQRKTGNYFIKLRVIFPPRSTEDDKKGFLLQIAQIATFLKVENQEE